jgi:S-(hydroxymethyl)glutathione dehydrogenase/alcohol dehydrogenase
MKVKAAVLRGAKEPYSIEELELAPPKAHEVQVKYAYTGYCHSDLSVKQGGIIETMPKVVGHECAGVVEAVGEGVTKAKVGDHVVCTWMVPCGECWACRAGLGNICQGNFEYFAAGVLLDGTSRYTDKDGNVIRHNSFVSGFSSHSVVPENGVIPVRKDFPLEQAALMACCVPTGWGTVTNIAKVLPGDSVAVWGLGGVGLNLVRAAAARQAYPLIAVDLQPEREALAREFGATHFICNDGTDPVPIIQDLTGGKGADVVFEAIGDPGAIVQAWWAVAAAGKLVIPGVMHHDKVAELPLQLLPFHQKSILGGLYGAISTHNDIPKYVDLAMTGEMKLDKLVQGKFKLEDINDIAEKMDKRQLTGRWVCEWD